MMSKTPSVSLLFQEDPWVYKILQIVSSDKVCVCSYLSISLLWALFPQALEKKRQKMHEKPSLPYTWVPTIHVIFISWLCIKTAWEDWKNPSVQAPAQPKGDRHSTGMERCLFSNSSGNFEQQRLRTPALFAWCPELLKVHSNPRETREVQDGKQKYWISAWVPTPSGKDLFHGAVQQSRLEPCGLGHFWKRFPIYAIIEDNWLKSLAGMPEYRAPGSMFFLWLPNTLPCVCSGVWISIVLEHTCLNTWTSYSIGNFSWLRKSWVVYFLIFVPIWGISHLKNIYVE